MQWLLRHNANEGLFALPTFVVVCAIVWLAKRFAWSDGIISAATITWIVAWGSVVFIRGERLISELFGALSKRKNFE